MCPSRSLSASFEVPQPASEAFATVLAELQDGLSRAGSTLVPGEGGRVLEKGEEIGVVTVWEPGRRFAFAWHPAPWKQDEKADVEVRFEVAHEGTRVTLEVRGWGGLFADDGRDLTAWFGSGVLAPLFRAISPEALGNWLTDRRVRRPTGPAARTTYADPTFHWPNFLLILDRIALRADDELLEVGCGGGAFMRKALESGCRATAIDHSPEMVRLTGEQNRAAVTVGRLRVLEAEADRLPVSSDTYSCAVMTGVIGFLPDPVAALKEIHRALRSGGRIAIFAGTAALKGTPAAPEPYASRIRFFEREEFEHIGRAAGFADVHVEEPNLEQYARAAKVPDEALALFGGEGGALLLTGRKV
jgi:SAM-dependent methyltransferase